MRLTWYTFWKDFDRIRENSFKLKEGRFRLGKTGYKEDVPYKEDGEVLEHIAQRCLLEDIQDQAPRDSK